MADLIAFAFFNSIQSKHVSPEQLIPLTKYRRHTDPYGGDEQK